MIMPDLDCLETAGGSRKDRDLVLYALSTCGWCRKARNFLEENDLGYRYVYVDLLEGKERDEVIAIVRKLNPKMSFPTLVIDEDNVVSGFSEETYNSKLL